MPARSARRRVATAVAPATDDAPTETDTKLSAELRVVLQTDDSRGTPAGEAAVVVVPLTVAVPLIGLAVVVPLTRTRPGLAARGGGGAAMRVGRMACEQRERCAVNRGGAVNRGSTVHRWSAVYLFELGGELGGAAVVGGRLRSKGCESSAF